ncbi:MAG: RHS repeat-associated core domain-containing protein [Anaerolineales bacterium]|nr:RHS repeat-associated core domain-containing protein [Anaerolineales bacterium]
MSSFFTRPAAAARARATQRTKPLGVSSREETRRSRGFRNELLYTGRRSDPETGLQLNRHRFYHQQLGRWVSRDPIGHEGNEWNLYEYVGSMPSVHLDPNGTKRWLWPLPWLWGCGNPTPPAPPFAVGPPTDPTIPPPGCVPNTIDSGYFPSPPAGACHWALESRPPRGASN